MPIRVGVIGAAGRMGATVCAAVVADKNLELVAAVDTASTGSTIHGLQVSKELRALADAKVEVAVDFTVAAASRVNLPWLAMHNIHAVVGTTGFTDHDLEDFKKMFSSSNCIVAPNFAIGAVLMMRFAEMAAPFFETAEIVEIHHDGKADSPSGTAIA
ncbi:MAG: 4-hydroxy-tetrahydrodipicolinate reductase, partial [Actinomycetota bacterium]